MKIKPSDGMAAMNAAGAVSHLREALAGLKQAGASDRCLRKVRKALSSAKGAVRHAIHRDQRFMTAVAATGAAVATVRAGKGTL